MFSFNKWDYLMHDLPPLNGLRAFEAAARHLSLTKAAAELNVSPGAISHQIRGLEALLGVQLFERRVRAIVLTAPGKLLYGPSLQLIGNLVDTGLRAFVVLPRCARDADRADDFVAYFDWQSAGER